MIGDQAVDLRARLEHFQRIDRKDRVEIAADRGSLNRALEHCGRSVRQDASLAALRFQRSERDPRVGKSIELEVRVEQNRLQRFVDAWHRGQSKIERALGENPEIRVVPRQREGPAVFELLRPPDRRDPIGIGPCLCLVTRDRRMDIEQRAIGVEDENG